MKFEATLTKVEQDQGDTFTATLRGPNGTEDVHNILVMTELSKFEAGGLSPGKQYDVTVIEAGAPERD